MTQEPYQDPRTIAQRRLETMVGRGEMTLSEFSERAEKIWAATCPAELEVALSGLPVPLDEQGTVAPARPAGAARISVDEGGRRTSVFDTVKREGRWRLPDDYHLTSWLGEVYLDAREAVVDRPRTRLKLDLWGANAKILLPPGVSVAVTGNRTLSELKIDEGRYEVDGGPHLDLEINGFMAGVKIKVLAAGERIPKAWKWL